ncbi:neuroblastoma breakpoint family member 4-like [Balaenoptera musculus]|uniref:Neuroblastoma breakpoint family member 4-like n=1 Tax=Balaenoptera musculus TaxID=9771 RepID=A0A8B8YJN6_BALMU|nr:neuroblastoma breakpoint family member 4-like [Balaenoptera musculus]
MELLVIEENEVQQDSLDECDLAGSIGHHLSDSCTPYRSASFQSDKREVSSVLSVNGDWEDCHQRPLSFQGPGVQTSQAQLQKSTHMTNYLQLQLDQHFNCGHSKATLGLSSTIWGFTANPDSGSQGPLFLELGLDASIGMKNPPKLKGEVLAASKHECLVYSKINALSVLKQKIIRRKLLFSKWRLACRIPGLQA